MKTILKLNLRENRFTDAFKRKDRFSKYDHVD